jgi:hypothetical protein
MKYENYKKATELVKEIDKVNELLAELKGDNVSAKLLSGQYCFMTIGAWSKCEHEAVDLAIHFVSRLIEFYTDRLRKLTTELEKQ